MLKNISSYPEDKFNNKIGWLNVILMGPIFMLWFWILGVFSAGINIGNSSAPLSMIYFGHENNYLHASQFGLIMSLFLIGNVTNVLLIALLVDRFSIKRIVNIFTLLFIVGLTGLLFSYGNFHLAAFFAFITGIAAGIVVVPFFKLAPQWFKPKNLALPLSIYLAIGISGGATINLLFTPFSKIHFYSHLNHNIFQPLSSSKESGGFPILACIILASTIFIGSFFIQEKKCFINKYYNGIYRYGHDVVKSLCKKQNIIVPCIIALMGIPLTVIAWSLHALISVYYEVHDKQQTWNGVISIMLVGYIIGSFIISYIADKIGKRKIIFIITNSFLVLFGFLLLIKTLSIIEIFLIFFMIGFWCSAQNIGYAMLVEQNKPDYIATINSWTSMGLLTFGIIIQNMFLAINATLPHVDIGDVNSPHRISTGLLAIIPIFLTIPLILSFFLIETGHNAKNKKLLNNLVNDYNFKISVLKNIKNIF